MRAPGEAPGLMALEIAMDEMAEKLGLDPVQFRIANDTQVDPEKPGRLLAPQFDRLPATGAEQFGWDKRNPRNPRRCATAAGWSAWGWPRLPQQSADQVRRARPARCSRASSRSRPT
jgi:CO/xanthine dehydrogenase Mo-binding subunit